ncbi:MAG: hypothetical protein AW09_004281 [Candidatus Accumulibacter phosphatis]|uniref:Uncharacterized protein n=1 Tax=Candidatus Accumulibacter phosphatis TaxID=327160 RepID=A0A080LR78_9PROT|nr:MAG: hypothetical protein AW09_004281 [Candidatus Accumulibacter phosphatis]
MHKATAREIDAELVVAQGTASLRQADFENPIGTIDDVDRLDGAICLGQGIEHDAQLGCVHPRLTADIVSQEAKMRRKFREKSVDLRRRRCAERTDLGLHTSVETRQENAEQHCDERQDGQRDQRRQSKRQPES